MNLGKLAGQAKKMIDKRGGWRASKKMHRNSRTSQARRAA
jgi:hypothetical protein